MKKLQSIILVILSTIFLLSTFVGCNSTSSKTSKEDESEILYPISEEKNGKVLYGYIDKEGKKVVDCKYDNTLTFINGMGTIIINGKQYFINSKGKIITDSPGLDFNWNFKEGLPSVRKNNKFGFIDKIGRAH